MKQRMDQPILWRILEAVKPRNQGYGAWYEHTKPVLLGMAALLVAVVSLWPTTFQVVAPARIESIGQFVLAAPLDGFVKHASVRPGDSVSTGQVLLTLDDRDLLSEKQKWQSQVQRLDKEYRDALSTQNAAETVIARSKRDEAIVQLQLAERQLSRITLQAPIDGLLISGDFIESAGVPVKRGQELLTIAPEHSFRAIIEIAEEDVELVSNGQKASLVLQSGTTQAIALAIDRVSPAAQLLRDQNIFEADANPVGHLTALRHGMRGLARIDIDKRLMGSIIWRQFSRQVRRLSWKFFG